jgi:hypothetical protein
VVFSPTQPDPLEHVARAGSRILTAGDLERQRDVAQRGQARHQVKRLEHDTDTVAPEVRQRVGVELAERAAVQPHAALDRRLQPGEQHQQCRLAGAGGADDRDRVAVADFEVHPRQHVETTVL